MNKTKIRIIVLNDLIIFNRELDIEAINKSYFSLWSAIKICNMCFIYRLIRFLPASKNIRIIVGTVFDEIRNGGAFFGFLFVCLCFSFFVYQIIFFRYSELLLRIFHFWHGNFWRSSRRTL